MTKKDLYWILIPIILIGLMIGVIFKRDNTSKEHFVGNKERLYEVAIDYLKENNGDYDQNKPDYQSFFDYEGLGITEDSDNTYVYMWILNESYYVEDDTLQTGSESSMFHRFTIIDGIVQKYEIPEDGSEYTDSIRKLCPTSKLANRVLEYDSKLSVSDQVKEHYSYLD